ncbi:MAG: helicase-exonuclease AddAB subunit AddB, partial [Lachnospiraceae bacterium]|nr:helicase-exonuclease AddAB subunit AddB [Lachnospiraceae bacterium]
MPLRFWLGGAASDKSRRLIRYILDEAEKNPQRQYLVVVPEQFGLSTQQELVFNSPNKGILNIDVLSFSRLAHRISDEVGSFASDITTLDDMGKSLLIGMLAAKHKRDLKVFGDNLDKPGYTDRIKSVISEFMQYGITVEKAEELARKTNESGRGLLAGKLSDIALIYGLFKEYTKDRYTTVEETLDAVSLLVPHSDTVKNSVIVFDGFTGFTPVQNKLIGVLMEYALDIHVALLLEDCIQENGNNIQLKEH